MTPSITIAFIYGAIFGSFLNMLLWRLPRGEGIGGRSRCISCEKALAWYDLIPIFSFLFLLGKCRQCKKSIPWRYLIVELICGLTLTAFGIAMPFSNTHSLVMLAAIFIFLALLFFDFYFLILPDVIVFPASMGFLAYSILYLGEFGPLVAGLLYALFFGMIYLVSKGRWLGFGDVKLAFLIGLVFGYPFGFFVVVGGIWIGAIVAIFLLASRRATLGKALPLGSFLSIAAILAIILRHEIQYFEHLFW